MKNIIAEFEKEENQRKKDAIAANRVSLIMHLTTIIICLILLLLHCFGFLTIDKSGKYLLYGLALGVVLSGIWLVCSEIYRFLKPKNFPLPRLEVSILWLVLGGFFASTCIFINQNQLECDRTQDICIYRNTMTDTIYWQRKLSSITKIEGHSKLATKRVSMFDSIAVSSENDPSGDGFCGSLILLQDKIISSLKNKTPAEELQLYINSDYPSFLMKSNCGIWTLFTFCMFIAGLMQLLRIYVSRK